MINRFALLVFGLLFCCSFDTFAQQKVEYSDDRIEDLGKKFVEKNEKESDYYGYRIQIVSISGAMSEERVKEAEKAFLDIYPEVYTYRVFESPNFKLRVGDFESRVTAEKFYLEIREDFPNAFVVKDKISIKALEEN
jgi:hypothetical protein